MRCSLSAINLPTRPLIFVVPHRYEDWRLQAAWVIYTTHLTHIHILHACVLSMRRTLLRWPEAPKNLKF